MGVSEVSRGSIGLWLAQAIHTSLIMSNIQPKAARTPLADETDQRRRSRVSQLRTRTQPMAVQFQ